MAMPVASSGAPVHRKTQGPLHAEGLCLAGTCKPSPREFCKGLPKAEGKGRQKTAYSSPLFRLFMRLLALMRMGAPLLSSTLRAPSKRLFQYWTSMFSMRTWAPVRGA